MKRKVILMGDRGGRPQIIKEKNGTSRNFSILGLGSTCYFCQFSATFPRPQLPRRSFGSKAVVPSSRLRNLEFKLGQGGSSML